MTFARGSPENVIFPPVSTHAIYSSFSLLLFATSAVVSSHGSRYARGPFVYPRERLREPRTIATMGPVHSFFSERPFRELSSVSRHDHGRLPHGVSRLTGAPPDGDTSRGRRSRRRGPRSPFALRLSILSLCLLS